MKKFKDIIIMMFSLILCIPVYSQEGASVKMSSYEYLDEQSRDVSSCCVEINNTSTDDYLTWISSTPVDDLSDEQLIRAYFFERKGDFSLASLMYECIDIPGSVVIGVDFIKAISNGVMFTYYLSDTSKMDYYRKRIVLLKRKTVEDIIKVKIPNSYLWCGDSIVLR